MIERIFQSAIGSMAAQVPAVFILGPRQCGKTTLAKEFLQGTYFDLERPSGYEVFASDPELALGRLGSPLILDEARALPALFPALRSAIDRDSKTNGRFYLPGSVSPALVRQVSESLAGRAGTVELTPFLYREVRDQAVSLDDCWLRGGYPDACLEADSWRRLRWYEQYLEALVQRDLAGYGLKATPQQMRRFLGMLAHVHGGLLNASELGRALDAGYHTISSHLDILEGHFLIRRLRPWQAGSGKRLIKSPKLYVRDCGLLHYLLGIGTWRDLLQSPRRGVSWEGMLVEQLITLENLAHSGSRFWFYRTHAGAGIDLIVEHGNRRTGYEMTCGAYVSRSDASGLRCGLADGVITHGVLAYAGSRRYQVADSIEAVPAEELLTHYADVSASFAGPE